MAILSRYLTRIREKKVRPYIKGKVLDIGCGDAKAINYKAVTRYFGVDLKRQVEKLTKKYPLGEFFSKNLENDTINLHEKVDLVLMVAFIEHIKNYENPISQSINNLKSGGRIVIFIKIAQKYNLKLKKYKKFELFCNQLVIFEK